MTNEEQTPVQSENKMESLAEYFQSTSLADMESSEVEVEPARYPMVSRSIRMEQAAMSEIRKVAKRRGMPVTQLMRQWIRQGLEQAKAEDAARDALHPSVEKPEVGTRSGTSIGLWERNVCSPGLSRSYSERLFRHYREASRETAIGWRIEHNVLVERGAQPARGKDKGSTARERSS